MTIAVTNCAMKFHPTNDMKGLFFMLYFNAFHKPRGVSSRGSFLSWMKKLGMTRAHIAMMPPIMIKRKKLVVLSANSKGKTKDDAIPKIAKICDRRLIFVRSVVSVVNSGMSAL